MSDGDFVVYPEAHAYFKSKTVNTIVSHFHRIWVANSMESRAKNNLRFELVVVSQI